MGAWCLGPTKPIFLSRRQGLMVTRPENATRDSRPWCQRGTCEEHLQDIRAMQRTRGEGPSRMCAHSPEFGKCGILTTTGLNHCPFAHPLHTLAPNHDTRGPPAGWGSHLESHPHPCYLRLAYTPTPTTPRGGLRCFPLLLLPTLRCVRVCLELSP